MSGNIQLGELIAYLVSRLVAMEASFGKTKLVKLLYLMDVEAYRRRSRKLTGLDWTFYHYGPYALAIDRVLEQLHLDIPQEEVRTAAGRRAIVFRPQRQLTTEFEQQASATERRSVDGVLNRWGLEELNPILSYVYFHTDPMKDAKRGEMLDFSKIQKEPTLKSPAPVVAPSAAARTAELREAFRKLKTKRSKQGEPLLPPPRFDEVFRQGLTHLVQEELYAVPRGEIDLTDQSKEQLRLDKEAG